MLTTKTGINGPRSRPMG